MLNNQSYSRVANLYQDSLPVEEFVSNQLLLAPFKDLNLPSSKAKTDQSSPFTISCKIFELISTYLITHPHLDHISALAINSAGFKLHKTAKLVIGSSKTISALQDHIFNGVIWPNMPSFKIINLLIQDFWKSFKVNHQYEITMFDLLHGMIHNNLTSSVWNGSSPNSSPTETPLVSPFGTPNPTRTGTPVPPAIPTTPPRGCSSNSDEVYELSAFLIKHTPLSSNILIFGDFESDLVSKLNKNARIWQTIAPLINNKLLLAIIMECSSCLSLTNIELYGHLMPIHLIKELQQLSNECQSLNPKIEQPLEGLNIIVNHVKESTDGVFDPKRKVQLDLEYLNQQYNLGVKFSIALGGITIRI